MTQVLNIFSTNAYTTKIVIVESHHKMGFIMIPRYKMSKEEASMIVEHLFYFHELMFWWVVTTSVFVSKPQ